MMDNDDERREVKNVSRRDEELAQIETEIMIEETTLESFHSKLTSIQKEMDEEEQRLQELQWEAKGLEDRQAQLKSQQAVNVELVKSVEGTLGKVIHKLRHKLDSTRTTVSMDSQEGSKDDTEEEEGEEEGILVELEMEGTDPEPIDKLNYSEHGVGAENGKEDHHDDANGAEFVSVPIRQISTERLRKQVTVMQLEVAAQRKLWEELERSQYATQRASTTRLLKGAPRLVQEIEGSILCPPTSASFFRPPVRLVNDDDRHQPRRSTPSSQAPKITEAVGGNQTVDPHVVLCPYELSGTCADDSCPYQHLTPTNAGIRRPLDVLPIILPPLNLPPAPDQTETEGGIFPHIQERSSRNENCSVLAHKRRRQIPDEERIPKKRTQTSNPDVTALTKVMDWEEVQSPSEGLVHSQFTAADDSNDVGTKAGPIWENDADFILLPQKAVNSDDELQSLDTNSLEECSETEDEDDAFADHSALDDTEQEDPLWYLGDADLESLSTDAERWQVADVLSAFGFNIVREKSNWGRPSSSQISTQWHSSEMKYETCPDERDCAVDQSIKMIAKAVTMTSFCLHAGRKDLAEAVCAVAKEYLSHSVCFRGDNRHGVFELLERIEGKVAEWMSIHGNSNTAGLSSLRVAFETHLALCRFGALLQFIFFEEKSHAFVTDVVAKHSQVWTDAFFTLLSETCGDQHHDNELCKAAASVVHASFSEGNNDDEEGSFIRRVASRLSSSNPSATMGGTRKPRDVGTVLTNCLIVGHSVASAIADAAKRQEVDPQVITNRIVDPLWLEVKRCLILRTTLLTASNSIDSRHRVLQALAVMGPVLLSWVSEGLRLLSFEQATNFKSSAAFRYESSSMNWDARAKGVMNGMMSSLDGFVKQLQTLVDRSGMSFEYAGLLGPLQAMRSLLAIAGWSFAKAQSVMTSCLCRGSDSSSNGRGEPVKRRHKRRRCLQILKGSSNASSSLLWSQLLVLRNLFPSPSTSEPLTDGFIEDQPQYFGLTGDLDQPLDIMLRYGVHVDDFPMLGDAILLEHRSENSMVQEVLRFATKGSHISPWQDSGKSGEHHGMTLLLNDTSFCDGSISDGANNGRCLFPRSILVHGHRIGELEMARCSLTSLPLTVGSYLEKLRSLNIEDNDVEELPPSFCELRLLERINLSHNCLVVLPDQIGNLDMLCELRASHNQLESLPVSLGDCQRLKMVDVRHNRIEQIASDLPLMLPFLQALELQGNPVEMMR